MWHFHVDESNVAGNISKSGTSGEGVFMIYKYCGRDTNEQCSSLLCKKGNIDQASFLLVLLFVCPTFLALLCRCWPVVLCCVVECRLAKKKLDVV